MFNNVYLVLIIFHVLIVPFHSFKHFSYIHFIKIMWNKIKRLYTLYVYQSSYLPIFILQRFFLDFTTHGITRKYTPRKSQFLFRIYSCLYQIQHTCNSFFSISSVAYLPPSSLSLPPLCLISRCFAPVA